MTLKIIMMRLRHPVRNQLKLKLPSPSPQQLQPMKLLNQIGSWALTHSAYINTTEHQLSHAEYKAGDSCPMLCDGRLYCIDPGVIVRVKGQNLASVHKY